MFEGGATFTAEPEATRNEALRLGIGRLLVEILKTMACADGRLHLYAGHDWTLMPLLMCVARREDAAIRSWPPFCASLSLELWDADEGDTSLQQQPQRGVAPSADGGRLVRVLYNGHPLELPCSARGDELCRLDDFRRMLAPYLVEDFAAECAACSADPPPAPQGSSGGIPAYNMPPSKL